MEVNQPPIQEITTSPNGRFPQVWIRWFENLRRVIETIRIATFEFTIICKTVDDLSNLQSGYTYFIDGEIDTGNTQITIPNGANIKFISDSLNNKGLYSTADNYTMFVTPSGEAAGNITCQELYLTTTGTNSKIMDLDNGGNNGACEFIDVNFGTFTRGQTTEIGVISNYRQFRTSGCAFINCAKGITFNGTMSGGIVVTDSIALALPAMTLLIEGSSLVIEGSLRSDINFNSVNSATIFTDFQESNFLNTGAFSLVNFRTTATNPIPNISSSSVYARFRNSEGLRNTYRGGLWDLTSEVVTPISVVETPYKLLGTTAYSDLQHFESDGNNRIKYIGDQPIEVRAEYSFSLSGTNGDQIKIYIYRYDDSAASLVEVDESGFITMNASGRAENINSFGYTIMEKNDYIEFHVENYSGARNITLLTDSTAGISER